MNRKTQIELLSDAMTRLDNIQLLNDTLSSLIYILPVLNSDIGEVVPVAEQLRAGTLAYADNVNWSPSDAAGLHWYNGTKWLPEDWTDATLGNLWVAYGAGFNNVGYRLNFEGRLCLRGVCKDGTLADGTLLFTLPAGYRPSSNKMTPIASDSTSMSHIVIGTGGTVNIYGMTAFATYLSLDGIEFEL